MKAKAFDKKFDANKAGVPRSRGDEPHVDAGECDQ